MVDSCYDFAGKVLWQTSNDYTAGNGSFKKLIEVEKVSGNNQLLTSFVGCNFKRSFCDEGSFDEKKKEQVYYVALHPSDHRLWSDWP